MRVLTICHVKLTQRTVLEQKRFDLRSLSLILCNLWLVLAYLKLLCVGNTRYPRVVWNIETTRDHRVIKVPNYLPGHPCVLQAFDCWDCPGQVLPLGDGAGLSQALLRYWVPPPHVLLHGPNELHEDQWPSTKRSKLKLNRRLISVSEFYIPSFKFI